MTSICERGEKHHGILKTLAPLENLKIRFLNIPDQFYVFRLLNSHSKKRAIVFKSPTKMKILIHKMLQVHDPFYILLLHL